ncbi:MAG: nitrate/nitrite transporter NrtS [Vicinamibacterales bacterium]
MRLCGRGRAIPYPSQVVLRRAGRTALVVGTALAVINHGPAMVRGEWTLVRLFQIAVSYLVPFIVATHAGHQARHDTSSQQ